MTSRKAPRRPAWNDSLARRLGPANAIAEIDAVDDYLAEIIGELERMARAHRKEMLAYLLSMAGVQAHARSAELGSSRMLH